MNLATLAERACLEAGYNDAADLVAAKKFARHWDEHIHNSALWKDALVPVTVAVDPVNNLDHADGIIYLPAVVDRVVTVRTPSNTLRVVNEEDYYRLDYDALAATGNPSEFCIRPPAWFKWRWSALATYLQISGGAGDGATAIRVIWEDAAGTRTTTDTTIGALAILTPADSNSITILEVYKAATTAGVTFGLPSVTVAPSASTFTVGYVNYNGMTIGLSYTITPGASENGYTLSNGAQTLNMVTGVAQTFVAQLTTVTLTGIPLASVTATVASVPSVTGAMAATDTKSPSYTRLRLLPIPTVAFTLTILAKRKYQDLDIDQQEPALRNLNNCLLAFIRGSLKRRGGENGQSQAEFAEANALLDKVKQIEALQAATNTRFIPEAGYGPEFGVGPRSAYFGN